MGDRIQAERERREKAEKISKKIFVGFLKEIHEQTDHEPDDWKLGYAEAILNLVGDFTNGQCEDCPFGYIISYENEEFAGFEHDMRCSLKECWIDRVKKLIWKEQEQLRKLTTLSNEILEKVYDEIISNKDFSKKLRGRVTMEELYKHIRKNYIRKLTVAQFKEFMQEFYEAYPLGDFGFEHASIVHPEVARYGFITKRGVQFYMHKRG